MSLKKYYEKTIDVKEENEIIEEATRLVFQNPSEKEVKRVITTLVESLIGGFNSYKSLNEYLDSNIYLKEWWELGQSKTFENGNYGWTMCVKEMLDQMSSKIIE